MGRQASLLPCPGLDELVGTLYLLLTRTLQSVTGQMGRPFSLRSSHVDMQKNPVRMPGLVGSSILSSPADSFRLTGFGKH